MLYNLELIYMYNGCNFYRNNKNCWLADGNNEYGQLGVNSSEKYIKTPTPIAKISSRIKQICISENNQTYFKVSDSEWYVCGENIRLRTDSKNKYIKSPKKVLLNKNIKDIKFVGHHTFGLINNSWYKI